MFIVQSGVEFSHSDNKKEKKKLIVLKVVSSHLNISNQRAL